MIIHLVHPSVDLYGSDKILLNSIQALESHDLRLTLPNRRGPLDKELELLPVECALEKASIPVAANAFMTFTGIVRYGLSFISFSLLMKLKSQADLVYLNTLAVLPVIVLFPKGRVLVHVHETLEDSGLFMRVCCWLMNKRGATAIAVSRAVENRLLVNGLDAGRVHKLYNGLAEPQSEKARVGLRGDMLVIKCIGRYRPKKGQWILLHALKLIRES